ncbi:MAG: flagellar brake protein [Gammaproteobacteria bacterium]|nr:flagellar brake protein [Gammaproteobacteria bacterium]MBU1646197.1 flagellar brake protein [Gammaproteobacteria bacterium]MBU1972259.1 flagellar brake protein [Gammaproteobacteria bacterium]
MNQQQTLPVESPSAPELLEPGDYSQYLLSTRNEILFVLRALLPDAARITVYFNEGRDFLLTTLVAIEEDTIILDYGSDAAMNRKALEADKLFCATQLENVKIQFILRGLAEVDYEGRPAFRAAFPDTVLRLQRREFFRLTVPIARPLRCIVPYEKDDGSRGQLEVKVMDISGGGLAIMSPPDDIGFQAGTEFPNCRLELPEVGIIVATLRVCNLFELTLRNGSNVKRAGCQFKTMPGPMLTLVQRYIIKVERERKARETGMN